MTLDQKLTAKKERPLTDAEKEQVLHEAEKQRHLQVICGILHKGLLSGDATARAQFLEPLRILSDVDATAYWWQINTSMIDHHCPPITAIGALADIDPERYRLYVKGLPTTSSVYAGHDDALAPFAKLDPKSYAETVAVLLKGESLQSSDVRLGIQYLADTNWQEYLNMWNEVTEGYPRIASRNRCVARLPLLAPMGRDPECFTSELVRITSDLEPQDWSFMDTTDSADLEDDWEFPFEVSNALLDDVARRHPDSFRDIIGRLLHHPAHSRVYAIGVAALTPALTTTKDEFIEVVEKALVAESYDTRRAAASRLETLADVDFSTYARLCENMLSTESGKIVYTHLEPFMNRDRNRFAALLRDGLSRLHDTFKMEMTKMIRKHHGLPSEEGWKGLDDIVLLSVADPDEYVNRMNAALSEDMKNMGLLGMLHVLAETEIPGTPCSGPAAYTNIVERRLACYRREPKPNAMSMGIMLRKLGPMVNINKDLYLQVLSAGLGAEDERIRHAAYSALALLAPVDEQRYRKIVQGHLRDASDKDARTLLATNTHQLAVHGRDILLNEISLSLSRQPKIPKNDTLLAPAKGDQRLPEELWKLPDLCDIAADKYLELIDAGLNEYYESSFDFADHLPRLAGKNMRQYQRFLRSALVMGNINPAVLSQTARCLERHLEMLKESLPQPGTDAKSRAIKYVVDHAGLPAAELRSFVGKILSDKKVRITDIARFMRKGYDLSTAEECARVNIPGFRVIRQTGQGAFKKAYLAKNKAYPSIRYVFKKVEPTLMGRQLIDTLYHGDMTAWLDQEMDISPLREVASKYVARVERPQLDRDGTTLYMVEAPYDMTLKDLLLKRRKLLMDEAIGITSQIIEGLHACVDCELKQIIHHDLKPNNVGLVGSLAAHNLEVRLSDFGQLSSIDSGLQDGEIVNPLYAAPHVLRGQPTDEAALCYTTGLMLFEMLTSKLLYLPTLPDGSMAPKPALGKVDAYKADVAQHVEEITNVPDDQLHQYLLDRLSQDVVPCGGGDFYQKLDGVTKFLTWALTSRDDMTKTVDFLRFWLKNWVLHEM